MKHLRTLTALSLLTLGPACGSERTPPGDGGPDDVPSGPDSATFGAEDQTPGFFRDTFRLLAAVNMETDAVAVVRLHSDIVNKLQNTVDLDEMLDHERNTVKGLLILALRTMQATEHHPEVAHRLGDAILQRVLQLDPARKAWNQNHPEAPVDVSQPGASLIAEATEVALADAVNAPVDGAGNPMPNALTAEAAAQCAAPTTRSSVWIPGLAELIWVNQFCYPDQYREGYCEPDRYVEGQCWDVWVEDCAGGQYENRGYYDYVCYTSTDCQYIWRNRWVWVGGSCDDGHYESQCTSGRYEPGLCYPDEIVPGICIPGHYSYFYPYGSWTFRSSGQTACDPVVPAQAAVARTSAKILSGRLSDDIADDSWRAAVLNLVALDEPPADADFIDAVRQILTAARGSED